MYPHHTGAISCFLLEMATAPIRSLSQFHWVVSNVKSRKYHCVLNMFDAQYAKLIRLVAPPRWRQSPYTSYRHGPYDTSPLFDVRCPKEPQRDVVTEETHSSHAGLGM